MREVWLFNTRETIFKEGITLSDIFCDHTAPLKGLSKSNIFEKKLFHLTTIFFSEFSQAGELLGKNQAEEVLVALSPLLERSHPPPSLCQFFSRYCRNRPRCPLVGQLFTPVVRRALKHNVVINCSTISLRLNVLKSKKSFPPRK